tara:strand:+ start:291 stop:692 length:402 start_codon:yes stop_codon:yes gene_type:complete
MIDLKIINIAANTTNYGLKKNSTHYASCRNKICGDKIKVEVNFNGTKIKNMRYETDSCIFCQASASVLSRVIKSIPIKNLRNEILKFYDSFNKDKFILPEKYSLFKPLVNKKNKNRLECIMLPFNAILKALKI